MRDMKDASELVLVTGITGFVASHCALKLLEKGYRVRGSLRSMKRADEMRQVLSKALKEETLNNSVLQFVELQLTSEDGWKEAMQDAKYVLHVASPIFTKTPSNPQAEIIEPAINGATVALKYAMESGSVKRFVLTSSIAAIVEGDVPPPGTVFDETYWTNVDSPLCSPYVKSKTLAEKACWEMVKEKPGILEMSVVNPGFVCGPVLEKDFGQSNLLYVKLMNHELPVLIPLEFPFVDARDLAELHILCMERPEAAGERFIAGTEECYSLRDVALILKAKYTRRSIPTAEIPAWLSKAFAFLDAELWSVRFNIGVPRAVTPQKAISRLGWTLRPVEESCYDTVESMFEHGVLER